MVIDPIQAYLGSDSDLQIAGRARKLMQRLGMWASVYDCAVVLIGHLNKKEGSKDLYRSFGSDNVNIKFTKNDHLKITNLDHIYSSRESRTSFVL